MFCPPINDKHDTNHLAEGWKNALTNQFRYHTPIVLGYGGNDGSLMNLLEGMEPGEIRGGIFWCYRLADGLPNERIRCVVGLHHGALIPVVGFDEVLLQLNNILDFGLLAEAVEQRAQQRAKHYREQVEAIQRRLEFPIGDAPTREADSEVKQALTATIERQKNWWAWELKSREATDPTEEEQIYRAGLAQFPDSAELTCNFALFMKNIRKDNDEAERLYLRALELDPNHALITGNFATFMTNICKNYDEAERLYCRTLELDPNNAKNTGNYGEFLLIQGRITEADKLTALAWRLNTGQTNDQAAGLALNWGLIAKLEQRDDAPALGRLKTLLTADFELSNWSFIEVLIMAKAQITDADYHLYAALAAAILDAGKIAELNAFPRWRNIAPIALNVPWDG